MFNMGLKGSLADEIGKELNGDGYICGVDFDLVIKSGEPVMVKWLRNDGVLDFYVKISLKCGYQLYDSYDKSLGVYKTIHDFIKKNEYRSDKNEK